MLGAAVVRGEVAVAVGMLGAAVLRAAVVGCDAGAVYARRCRGMRGGGYGCSQVPAKWSVASVPRTL